MHAIYYSDAEKQIAFRKTAHFEVDLNDRLVCHHQLLAYPDNVSSTALLQMLARAVADISLALVSKEPK